MTSTWRDQAQATRTALAQLGYPVPDRLPAEPNGGGSDAEHTTANLGALRAAAGYRTTHLGSQARPPAGEVTARVGALVAGGPGCDQGHQEVTW